ncbi:hypothetical protein QVA66_07045 [Staphylococcus chromogenes]|nr:hypothetical protein [Staphylococcus chromogenes]
MEFISNMVELSTTGTIGRMFEVFEVIGKWATAAGKLAGLVKF